MIYSVDLRQRENAEVIVLKYESPFFQLFDETTTFISSKFSECCVFLCYEARRK